MAKSLLDFLQRLHAMQARAAQLSSKEVVVGWANDAREQPRAQSKEAAIAANAKKNVGANGRKRPRGEFVSNFDADFVGPGRQAASLATIAKTLCYGREGGTTKSGHKYGRIPARDFVRVLKEKHWRPLNRAVATKVIDLSNTSPDVDMNFIGVVAKGQLQRAMKDSNEYAPNAPITIHGGWMADPKTKKPFYVEPKNSERPLWNSGKLIRSVDFEVKDK